MKLISLLVSMSLVPLLVVSEAALVPDFAIGHEVTVVVASLPRVVLLQIYFELSVRTRQCSTVSA